MEALNKASLDLGDLAVTQVGGISSPVDFLE
jgi:hypothetical protein